MKMQIVLLVGLLLAGQAYAAGAQPSSPCEAEALRKAQPKIEKAGGGAVISIMTLGSPEANNTPDQGSISIVVAQGKDRFNIDVDVKFASANDPRDCTVHRVNDAQFED
jgi:hypothetical protein